jgi:hypothetical protein
MRRREDHLEGTGGAVTFFLGHHRPSRVELAQNGVKVYTSVSTHCVLLI